MRDYLDFAFMRAEVVALRRESRRVKSFYLEFPVRPEPGQFFMVWLPGSEEIPISASGFEDGVLRLTVASVGGTTRKMMKLEIGDALFLRGPFGQGFDLGGAGRVMLVGGGYGSAPLIYAGRVLRGMYREVVYVAGAKSAEDLLFLEEAKSAGMRVEIATDDGSAGWRGTVAELAEKLVDEIDPERILTCGPEPMMRRVVEMAVGRGIGVQASLERYMKCGFGICGSCVLDPVGLRVCVDGPVFDGKTLLQTDFGKWRRDPAGRRVPV